MQWTRSDVIGLAKATCVYCKGTGMRPVRITKETPCNCAFRSAFRACLNRFRECVTKGAYTSTVSLEFCRGQEGRRTYSRKREEYMADFCLVSKRTLDETEYKVFRFHFLLGADWKLCCRQLKMDRGTFFHLVYRIEQKLGRTFAELEPYPLYPLADYFSGTIRRNPAHAIPTALFPPPQRLQLALSA
jgi:hypothetical protein